MVAVVGKNKKKTVKKAGPAKKESKFISQALINRKKSKGKKKKRPKTKGLVYVRNLPHGFFEEQLRKYFSQFGAVTRLRLGRSPKTLNSRGYAFVEFRYPEVAQIAAETMNNYIMFHRIVKTKFIPPNEIYHDYFRSSILTVTKNGEKVLTSKSILARESNVENTNKLMTDDDQKSRIAIVKSKVSKQKAKLAKLGIDFDVDLVAKNMGEEVISRSPKKNASTIEHLNDDELDDSNDETFDPAKFDIESDDEFEDFAYESEGSESDDIVEETKKQKAIEIAKSASKKYKETKGNDKTEELPQNVDNKKGKNRKVAQSNDVQPEEPGKKARLTRKAAEKKEPQIEKPSLKKTKVVEKKIPATSKTATKPKAKSQIEPAVEKVVKKLKEKKKVQKAKKRLEVKEAAKKVEKVTIEKAKIKTVNVKETSKESPKLAKAPKVVKKAKKVAAGKK